MYKCSETRRSSNAARGFIPGIIPRLLSKAAAQYISVSVLEDAGKMLEYCCLDRAEKTTNDTPERATQLGTSLSFPGVSAICAKAGLFQETNALHSAAMAAAHMKVDDQLISLMEEDRNQLKNWAGVK